MKERSQKIKLMNKIELEKERASLIGQILALRVDIANRKTKGIHKIKFARRDIARINTTLTQGKDKSDSK